MTPGLVLYCVFEGSHGEKVRGTGDHHPCTTLGPDKDMPDGRGHWAPAPLLAVSPMGWGTGAVQRAGGVGVLACKRAAQLLPENLLPREEESHLKLINS